MSVGVYCIPLKVEPGWPANQASIFVVRWPSGKLGYLGAISSRVTGPLGLLWSEMRVTITVEGE